ncbi:MAG: hypothetical protein R6V52_12520, partial [Bacteroidales bacterium]
CVNECKGRIINHINYESPVALDHQIVIAQPDFFVGRRFYRDACFSGCNIPFRYISAHVYVCTDQWSFSADIVCVDPAACKIELNFVHIDISLAKADFAASCRMELSPNN